MLSFAVNILRLMVKCRGLSLMLAIFSTEDRDYWKGTVSSHSSFKINNDNNILFNSYP